MSKADKYQMADYILSQDHERDNLIEKLSSRIKEEKVTKWELRQEAYSHIFYIATKSLHGRGEAGKIMTEILKEVFDE